MTLKVVELQPKPRERNEEIISALRATLERAEKGEIVGIAIAYMDHMNAVTYVKGGVHSFGTIGALQLMSNQIERAIE